MTTTTQTKINCPKCSARIGQTGMLARTHTIVLRTLRAGRGQHVRVGVDADHWVAGCFERRVEMPVPQPRSTIKLEANSK